MFNIEPNPKNWKIPTADGKFISGYFEYIKYKNVEIGETNNIIFDARIKIVSFGRGRSSVFFEFVDIDDGNKYFTGPKGMLKIMEGVQEEKISKSDNCFFGTFTFQKQGENIYLFPYEE